MQFLVSRQIEKSWLPGMNKYIKLNNRTSFWYSKAEENGYTWIVHNNLLYNFKIVTFLMLKTQMFGVIQWQIIWLWLFDLIAHQNITLDSNKFHKP